MRVGLALGAGGVVGASWMVGALDALEQRTSLRAGDVAVLLGTSVGSLIATLAAGGVPTAAMAAYLDGESGGALAHLGGHDAMAMRLARVPFPLGPGSLRMMLAARSRDRVRHGAAAARRRPHRRDQRAGRAGDRHEPGRSGGQLRIVACDYASGERVEFARDRSPKVTPGQAVAASCAIPAVYEPVRIGARRYIDGGVHSHSNLDLLDAAELDALIALNPMSSSAWVGGGGMRERLDLPAPPALRGAARAEVRALRVAGIEGPRAGAGVRGPRRDGA